MCLRLPLLCSTREEDDDDEADMLLVSSWRRSRGGGGRRIRGGDRRPLLYLVLKKILRIGEVDLTAVATILGFTLVWLPLPLSSPSSLRFPIFSVLAWENPKVCVLLTSSKWWIVLRLLGLPIGLIGEWRSRSNLRPSRSTGDRSRLSLIVKAAKDGDKSLEMESTKCYTAKYSSSCNGRFSCVLNDENGCNHR